MRRSQEITFPTDVKLVFILGACVLQQQAHWLGQLQNIQKRCFLMKVRSWHRLQFFRSSCYSVPLLQPSANPNPNSAWLMEIWSWRKDLFTCRPCWKDCRRFLVPVMIAEGFKCEFQVWTGTLYSPHLLYGIHVSPLKIWRMSHHLKCLYFKKIKII